MGRQVFPQHVFIYHKKVLHSWSIFETLIYRIVISMCYYGVTMYAGTIGGNFFFNFLLLAVIEFPAFVNIPMLDHLGRKWTHVIFMLLGGVACVATIFTVVYGGDGMFFLSLFSLLCVSMCVWGGRICRFRLLQRPVCSHQSSTEQNDQGYLWDMSQFY